MKIYGDSGSGNCHKVKFVADFLGLSYQWQEVDIMQGGSHTAAFLQRNPQGQVPVLELDDGRCIAQSNGIIRYLAAGTELLPDDLYRQAKVDEWLFWEQYSHEPYIAVCRFQMVYLGRSREEREDWRVERGERALDHMEQVLRSSLGEGRAPRQWLVSNELSIADASLLAYTRMAAQGGFELHDRPRIRDWIFRAEAKLGLSPEI